MENKDYEIIDKNLLSEKVINELFSISEEAKKITGTNRYADEIRIKTLLIRTNAMLGIIKQEDVNLRTICVNNTTARTNVMNEHTEVQKLKMKK